MSKSGSWWGPSTWARDQRATPVEEDIKQPKFVRHEPKNFSVQWRVVQTGRTPVWEHHKDFETLKRAESWVQTMNTRERRRSTANHGSAVRVEYRVNPIHYGPVEEEPIAKAADPTLAMRALLDPK